MRLISSGIRRSKLRSPASTCATATPSFTAEVGRGVGQNALERLHDARGLGRVRARPHAEVDVGPWELQVFEEDLRHVVVVVLPGVDQGEVESAAFIELAPDRRDLHEVRPRADDGKYLRDC
jgi:hypothetical protein